MIRETVEITDLSFDGRGIGRCADGRVVFAPRTLPGDLAELRISGEGRSLTGRLLELKQASEHRIEPDCPYFGRCGGCSLRNFAYEAQLAWKRDFVYNALVRIGGLQDPAVRPARGMNHPYRYRNKAVFAVDEGVPGFFASGTRELVPIDGCLLLKQEICDAFEQERASLSKNCTKLTFRSSHFGEVMTVKEYSNGNITSDRRMLEDIIETELSSLKLEVGPQSFYQVNPQQAGVLYSIVQEYADPQPSDTLLDLYCGAGVIGLSMAGRCGRVIGVESFKPAIIEANRNAAINGIVNAIFVPGRAEKVVEEKLDGVKAQIAVLDPPRAGCKAELLDALLRIAPDRIVYVSCNPATLSRDVKILTGEGYKFIESSVVDMFPFTTHVECVTLMSRAKG